ncbi:mitochondrial RNA binding protein 2, putative [Bodo saltans]|uniref:Mitochondrial RNA binding protein 2, putative n=1 Tax=Bodo saltans TaxID=75058 RepID=A0A0S4JES7_BODSA|nr:mitochondrial RNA binding protein 2, putative [Bodo saltans]|eukprot:CUG88678.1 mitochondrial RNA binding protein 2, putative [Bodo saltans]
MRRLASPVASGFMVSAIATLSSVRNAATRRMLLPIAIQAEDTSLVEAKLLIKWTSMTKKVFHLVPLIIEAKDSNGANSTATNDAQNAPVQVDAPSSAKASQTFRRITLGSHDLAGMICVLENKLPSVSFACKAFSVKMEKDTTGVVTLKGHVVPYETAGVDESKKMLFVGALDVPTSILLKSHLESVLTEIFGIEHVQHLAWRQQVMARQNSYQQNNYNYSNGNASNSQHRSSGYQGSRPRHPPQQQQQQPRQQVPRPEVIRSASVGQFASQLDDGVIVANSLHSTVEMVPPAEVPSAQSPEAPVVEPVARETANVEKQPLDSDSVKTESQSAPASAKKKSKSSSKKSKSRADKKKADSDAQELFEM